MLTPFEQIHNRAAAAGLRIIEALAVNRMITAARVYETQMAEHGGGVPPLSEALTISMMWNDVTQFTAGEA